MTPLRPARRAQLFRDDNRIGAPLVREVRKGVQDTPWLAEFGVGTRPSIELGTEQPLRACP